MASKLIAEVCRVEEVQPHPNADRLNLARIKNWWCVVKKDGNLFAGDKVVYIPPETVVPTKVADAWGVTNYCSRLPKRGDGTRPDGVRVRATRIRDAISQGLILPVEDETWDVGYSVVEHYGLSKYEPPPPVNSGEAIPEPPGFHHYTDIENIGNYPGIFEEGEEVVVDEKIHGTNGRAAMIEGEFYCGGHRQCLKEFSDDGKPCVYWNAMDDKMRALLSQLVVGRRGAIVFVEIFGRKIQDMEYGMNTIGYRAYDIAVDGEYLDYDTKLALFQGFGIEMAPILYRGPFSMAKMNELVDGPTTLCDPKDAGRFSGREGIVIRPVVEQQHPQIGRKILKMISVDYHERKGDKTEYH